MTKERGRIYAIQSREDGEAKRLSYMIENMVHNKAYIYAKEENGGDLDGVLLTTFRDRFQRYRESWRAQPRSAIEQKLTGECFQNSKMTPLCIDIEVAAVCDLACPFCYRQFIATPDKVISDELSFRLIDEAVNLGVPSLKFNWRGEPLLYPRLAELIAYAKKRGILETIINTNATCLTAEISASLIDAGLDMIIYSFDGGSKESYESMRPGRFKDNSFEQVYSNICRFSEIRRVKGALFPRTKIQMILTDKTFSEIDRFYVLFNDYVDDVSVKQYTERGGKLSELDQATQMRLQTALAGRNLDQDTPFFRDISGKLHVAIGRLPCEQPYQRLLVTYDGRAGMCCYDWGAQHPVGYTDKLAIENGEVDYARIVKRAKAGDKGFIQLKNVNMPSKFNNPAPIVQNLSQIWTGSEIDRVRAAHVGGGVDNVPICKKCPFKETYQWEVVED